MTLPPYPERVEGRRQFRQVVQTGTFRKSFIGGWQFADGWIFKTGGVDWNPNELYGFLVDTLETIRALEGPATW